MPSTTVISVMCAGNLFIFCPLGRCPTAGIDQEIGGGNCSAGDLHDTGMSMGLKNSSDKECALLLSAD